jgi:hypothetical protein
MITLSLMVLECTNPSSTFLPFGRRSNLDQNPPFFFSWQSLFPLLGTKASDLLLVRNIFLPLKNNGKEPFPWVGYWKWCIGDEYEENEEYDDKEQEEEQSIVLREAIREVVALVGSWESFSLRQTEQTPGGCSCFGCFLHLRSGFDRPFTSFDLHKLAIFGFGITMWLPWYIYKRKGSCVFVSMIVHSRRFLRNFSL